MQFSFQTKPGTLSGLRKMFSYSLSLTFELNTTSIPSSSKKWTLVIWTCSLSHCCACVFALPATLSHLYWATSYLSFRCQLKHILWGSFLIASHQVRWPCNVFLSWNVLFFIIIFCFSWLFSSLTGTTWERDCVCFASCGLPRGQHSVWWE